MKSQTVRLLDVFVLGPGLVYFSLKAGPLNNFERKALGILGMATIIYNWKNYREQSALEAQADQLQLPEPVVEALDFISQGSA